MTGKQAVSKEKLPMATVHTDENGQLVLVDPVGYAVLSAVAKVNCAHTAQQQLERVQHFQARMAAYPDRRLVIQLINVDSGPLGKLFAEASMPGMDWQPIRDRGEVPFARGLGGREGITELVAAVAPEIAKELEALSVPVLVVDHGGLAVFEADAI